MDAAVSTAMTRVLIGGAFAFGLYRRFRRTFGRQPVATKSMIARIVIFSLIATVMLVVYFSLPMLGAAALGASAGSTLAFFGLRLTTYEATADGKFYTPNRWIGLAVTALFLGRVGSRLVTIYSTVQAAEADGVPNPWSGMQKSPLTLGIFFVLASYYVIYLGGVLRKAKTVTLPTV